MQVNDLTIRISIYFQTFDIIAYFALEIGLISHES
jgi:hypothetical protein